jgi:phage portal protein BeeE
MGSPTLPVTTATLRYARLTADATANWTAEQANIALSQAAFDSVLFTAHKLAVLVAVDNELLEGALNAGKMPLLEEGLTVESIGFSAEDSQFVESRQFSVIEIARWFSVPPTLIGDMTRVSEMQLYATQSVVPWCANFESEINAKLFPSRTKFCARFDVNSMTRGDQASR